MSISFITATRISFVRKALRDAKDQGKHDVLIRLKTGEATKFVAVAIGQKSAG